MLNAFRTLMARAALRLAAALAPAGAAGQAELRAAVTAFGRGGPGAPD